MSILKEHFPFLAEVPDSLKASNISLTSEVQQLSADERIVLATAIVGHFLAHDRRRLGELASRTERVADRPIALTVRSRRVRQALARAGVNTWGDLSEYTPAELTRFPGMGRAAARDVLACLVLAALSYEQEPDWPDKATVQSPEECTEIAVETLRLLATWAARERPIERMEGLLDYAMKNAGLPVDLHGRWRYLAGVCPRTFAYSALLESRLDELLTELLESLDDTERLVYERRVMSEPRRTLEEVGREIGLTRERVRQLQISAEECIGAIISCRRYLPLYWRAHELRDALGQCAPRQNPVTGRALAVSVRDAAPGTRQSLESFLLLLAGPYRERDGWLQLKETPALSVAELVKLADRNGVLPIDIAYQWLNNSGVVPAFHDAWLEHTGRLRRIGSSLLVWVGSIADKGVALLAASGTPADAETLVKEVGEGHSVRSAQNAFLADKRLVRVSRTEWALRTWNLEEYSGITEEIAQRIEKAGGRVCVADVVAELVQQFGVKDASVRVYAEAPMFVLEDGWVRLRTEEEPLEVRRDLLSCRGAYNWAEKRISVVIQIDKEALRGSGRAFPAGVAAALGVVPGRPRTFKTHSGCQLAIRWPMTSAFGPSLSSIRTVALAANGREGDRLRFDFLLQTGQVDAALIPSSLGDLQDCQALRLLTGLSEENDPVEQLADALDVPKADVKRVLIERGDEEVARLLPAPEHDKTLQAALDDLANSLES